MVSIFFLSLPQKERKKSRQEGYTAPSCHTALWDSCATVACTIDHYCTPLMDAAFTNRMQWVHLIS